MAYDVNKLSRLKSLKDLATRTKTITDGLSTRVGALEAVGAQANVLEGVKVNGTALAIAEKIVDILITTGTANGTIKVNGTDVSVAGLAAMAYKADVSEEELAAALATKLNGKADASTVYTKAEVDGIISAVYKPAGSVAFANLPALSVSVLGNVYNVTNAFTTTADFVEGAGKKHPAGTNVVVVAHDNDGTTEYKFDVLAGFVDLSGYAEKDTDAVANNFAMFDANHNPVDSGKNASSFSKVTATAGSGTVNIDGTDIALFDVATDAEVTEMLDEVFGA